LSIVFADQFPGAVYPAPLTVRAAQRAVRLTKADGIAIGMNPKNMS
jgi:hypothetical protein